MQADTVATAKAAAEAFVEHDTPAYREKLAACDAEVGAAAANAEALLALAQNYVRASAAMAEARDALTNGIVSLGTVAFNHAELAAAASATPAEEGTPAAASGDSVAALGQELFAKLALAQDMEARQVHSLLVEPLQALLDDPRGPASASKIYAAFSNASTDYYDALNEFCRSRARAARWRRARTPSRRRGRRRRRRRRSPRRWARASAPASASSAAASTSSSATWRALRAATAAAA